MTFAQAREDDWLIQQFEPDFRGYALDIGAYDGTTRSNTFLLEKRGWTVVCVEPNPDLAPKLRANRAFVEVAACDKEAKASAPFKVHLDNPEAYSSLRPSYHKDWHPDPHARWATIEVPVTTANDLLERWEFPRLDALSIDTEGTELDVLMGLDLSRWSPKAIILESWDEECPATTFLEKHGYRKVGRLLVNNLYLKETE